MASSRGGESAYRLCQGGKKGSEENSRVSENIKEEKGEGGEHNYYEHPIILEGFFLRNEEEDR